MMKSGLAQRPEWFGLPCNSTEKQVEFYVFDAVSHDTNVVLFGKTKEGKSMCLIVQNVWTHLYFVSNLSPSLVTEEEKENFYQQVNQFLHIFNRKFDGQAVGLETIRYLYPTMYHASTKPKIHTNTQNKLNTEMAKCFQKDIQNANSFDERKDLYIQEGGKYKQVLAQRVVVKHFNQFRDQSELHKLLREFRKVKFTPQKKKQTSSSSSSSETNDQVSLRSEQTHTPILESFQKGSVDMIKDIIPRSDTLLNQFRLERNMKGLCKITLPFNILVHVPNQSKKISSCQVECLTSQANLDGLKFEPVEQFPFALKCFSLQTFCHFNMKGSAEVFSSCEFPYLSFRIFENKIEMTPSDHTFPMDIIQSSSSSSSSSPSSPLFQLCSKLLSDPSTYFWTWCSSNEEGEHLFKSLTEKFEEFSKVEPQVKKWMGEQRICIFSSQREMFEQFYKLFVSEDPDVILQFEKGSSQELSRLVFTMQKLKVHTDKVMFNRWKDHHFSSSHIRRDLYSEPFLNSIYSQWNHGHLTRGRICLDLFDQRDSFMASEDLHSLKSQFSLKHLGRASFVRIHSDVYQPLPRELLIHCFKHHLDYFIRDLFVSTLLEQEIMHRAFLHSNVLLTHFSLSSCTGVLLSESFLANRSFLNEHFISFSLHEEGFILPTALEVNDSVSHWEEAKSMWEEVLRIKLMEGGKSLDAQVGYRSRTFLEMLDVKSSYPSQVIEFGLCLTKFPQFGEAANPLKRVHVQVKERSELNTQMDKDIAKDTLLSLVYQKQVSQRRKQILTKMEKGNEPSEEEKQILASWGVLPRVLFSLVQKRSVLQKALKEQDLSVEDKKKIEALRQSYKMIVNTVCGCFWQKSFRFYNPIFGRLIPLFGRQTLRFLADRIEYKTQKVPIFGVTDSLKFDTKKMTLEEVNQLVHEIMEEKEEKEKEKEEEASGNHRFWTEKQGCNLAFPFIQVERNQLFRASLDINKSSYVGISILDRAGQKTQWVHKSVLSDSLTYCYFAQQVTSYIAHELLIQPPDLVQRIIQALFDAGLQLIAFSEANSWDSLVCFRNASPNHMQNQNQNNRDMRNLCLQTSSWSSYLASPRVLESLVLIDYQQASRFFVNEIPHVNLENSRDQVFLSKHSTFESMITIQCPSSTLLLQLSQISKVLVSFTFHANVHQASLLEETRHVGINLLFYWTKQIEENTRPFLEFFESDRKKSPQDPPKNPKIPIVTHMKCHEQDKYQEKLANVRELVRLHLLFSQARRLVEAHPLLAKLTVHQLSLIAMNLLLKERTSKK